MALAAETYSDFVMVTNDNPRSEDPEKIAQEIVAGFRHKNYLVELDRKKAIEKALSMADPDDIILLAGKGHEPYQIFAHKTVEFDDRKAAAEAAYRLSREPSLSRFLHEAHTLLASADRRLLLQVSEGALLPPASPAG